MSQTAFITLAPGKQEGDLPTTRLGVPSNVLLLKDKVIPVRPDDSREEGIGETLATRLVQDGRCIYCAEDGSPMDGRAIRQEAESSTTAVSLRQKKVRVSEDAGSEPDAAS